MKSIIACLQVLLNEGAEPTDMSQVAAVMACKGGAKKLVSQMITQNAYLNQRETTVRQNILAWTSFGEDIVKSETLMQGEAQVTELRGLHEKMALWKKAFRNGGWLPDVAMKHRSTACIQIA